MPVSQFRVHLGYGQAKPNPCPRTERAFHASAQGPLDGIQSGVYRRRKAGPPGILSTAPLPPVPAPVTPPSLTGNAARWPQRYMDTDGFNRGAGDRAFFRAESRTKCAAEPHADQGTSKCPSSSAKSTILPSLDARPIA